MWLPAARAGHVVTRATRGHLALVKQDERATPLVRPVWPAANIASLPQLVAAVVAAAEQWAYEAEAMASDMGWAPSEFSDLGVATLRLLDAVRTLQARDVAPPDSRG